MSFFELYWQVLGLPLSKLKGAAVEAAPFSFVESVLWIGGIATAVLILSFLPGVGLLAKAIPRRITFFLGPVLLIALGLGQGAFPLSLAPTAWRNSLAESFGVDSLQETEFRIWVAERETRLRREFYWPAYASLGETEALVICNRALDLVLQAQGLPPGRSVSGFKDMGPLTTSLGLVYGGPAYHDPVFGEIGIVKESDYPTPRHWRLIAACHEAAHAKGFTREMDAELLTQLAFLQAGQWDPRFRLLADIHFLNKSGLKLRWPEGLLKEGIRVRAARKEVEKRQPLLMRLRRWAEKLGLRNSPRKYGDRGFREPWNPGHPFYASLRRLETRAGSALP